MNLLVENKKRKADGAKINNDDILKHKSDVFRLSSLLTSDDHFELPEKIKSDLQSFVDMVSTDLPGKDIFKVIELKDVDVQQIFDQLIKTFELSISKNKG